MKQQRSMMLLLMAVLISSGGGSFAQAINDTVQVVDLKTALAIARENYPSIRMKRAATQAAQYELNATRFNYVPSVVAQGQILNGTSNQVRGPFFPNEGMAIPISAGIKPNGYTSTSTWTSFATGFVNWKFFSFGKIRSEVNVAKADITAAEADYQNEIFQQQIKVGDAYLLSLMTQSLMYRQRVNLGRVKALQEVTKAYTQSGLKPGVDSSLVNAEYSKATLQYLEAARLADEQQVYLAELMGLKTDVNLLLDTAIYTNQQPQPLEMSKDYSKNPRLLLFMSQVDASQARISSIRRSQHPSVSLIGASWARGSGIADQLAPNGDLVYNKSFGAGVGFRPYLDWMVGVSTIWNITSLFKTGEEAKAQRHITTMARERYNEETLRVESEVERAQLRYVAALEAARQAPIQLNAAHDAYQQALARYNAGFSTILELTQTFTLLNRAEVDAAITRGNVWRAVIAVAAATGNLDLFTANLK